MTEATSDRTIVEDLLVYTTYDWIDLGHLRSVVREGKGVEADRLHSACMSVISELIGRGLVAAGDVVDGHFTAWPGTRAQAIDRIDEEWRAQPDPALLPFEVAALAPCPAAIAVVEAVMDREGGDQSWRPRMLARSVSDPQRSE